MENTFPICREEKETDMKEIEKSEKGTPEKTTHVKICKTDFEISGAMRKVMALGGGEYLSKHEVGAKITPEPFGP